MDPIIGEYLANAAAQTKAQGQVKLFKGALKQEGEVVMKLIEGAVSPDTAPARENFHTGHTLSVAA